MLLQTLVQLNILLLAAPALVGWAALPAAHPLLAQAAQVAFLSRARQSTPQTINVQRASQRPITVRPAVVHPSEASCLVGHPATTEPFAASPRLFPRTTRAP